MKQKRNLVVGIAVVAIVGALWIGQGVVQTMIAAQSVEVPRFEVDPLWPKPLPNAWVLGSTIGLWVDDQDLVWIVHRPETLADNEASLDMDVPTSRECCRRAPPVVAFDLEGNVVHAWGYPAGHVGDGFTWPESNHGIFVDHEGYVWIGGNGGPDSHILKFTKDGRFIAQYGVAGARSDPTGDGFVRDSDDRTSFGRVAKVFVDPDTNEAYVADGYFNRRVAVLDAGSGEMLRYWGAYGNEPEDEYAFGPRGEDFENQPPAQQFRGPVHCADVTRDGLVYVCDRQENRIQVFTRDGEFVREAFYQRNTLGEGSTWDVAFSRDPEQRFIYLADGRNQRVRIIDRQSMEELTAFGRGGRYPGHFFSLHSIATDSHGNIYTTETYQGKRLQKFAYMGAGAVTARDQDAPWPQ
jgi:hypothetical protein